MKKIICLLLTTALLASCGKLDPIPPKTNSVNVNVPGTSNPYLAGMPNGTTASGAVDIAPAQSPVLVPIALLSGGWIEASNVTGSVNYASGLPLVGPEGSDVCSHSVGAEHGKSNVIAPCNSLIGVFLDNDIPTGKVPPDELDFTSQATRDYLEFHPKLKQVFFIGDGKTSGGTQQKLYIPQGATRLFLGTMDGYGWYNNEGAFKAAITQK
jgi:hypothetical protein